MQGSSSGYTPRYYGSGSYNYSSTYGYSAGGGYRSPSSWWKGKMGAAYDDDYSFGFTGGAASKVDPESANKFRLQRALFQLARVVNIVENSHVGEREKPLTLRWSDGAIVNHPGNEYVTLSSTDYLSVSDETQAIDMLTGQSLMLSGMKRTMNMTSFLMYHMTLSAKDKKDPTLDKSRVIAAPLFEATEVVKAKHDVLKDWEGFSPYFDVHQELSNTMKKDDVVAILPDATMNPEAFAHVVGWNVMNPHNRVTFGDAKLDDLLNVVEERVLDIPEPSDQDFNRLTQIGSFIIDQFPPPPPEDQQGEDEEGEDEGEGEAGSGEGSGISGNGGAGADQWSPPKRLTDTNLFGQIVEGNQAQDGTHQLSLDDQSLQQNDPLNNLDYYPDKDVPLTSLGVVRAETKSGTEYNAIVRKYRNVIKAIRNSLAFRSTKQTRWTYGMEEGELDEGAFHKIASNNPSVFAQRRVEGKADVAISILLDLSGSMGYERKFEEAMVVAVALTEALKDLPGVYLNVLGHTADCDPSSFRRQTHGAATVTTVQDGHKVMIAEYLTRKHANPYALAHVNYYDNNYDGYAIEYAAKRLMRDFPNVKNRMVIVLSDGRPCNGNKHVRGAVENTRRKLGTEVYAIGIKNAYTADDGVEMFGKGYSVVIGDVLGSLNILTPFLKRKLSRF